MNTFCKILLIIIISLSSCSDLFEFSPYDIDVPGRLKLLNKKNMGRFLELEIKDSLQFAVIADIHAFYDDLEDVVSDINSKPEIEMVFIDGDLTDLGLLKEYVMAFDRLEKLKCPYFAVIGNHDYLSNGEKIFRKIFEKTNYSLSREDVQFVIFDDIYWENNNTPPDLEWLDNELTASNAKFKILFTHIPLWSDCYPLEITERFRKVLTDQKVSNVFFGHNHNYEQYVENGINYIVTGSVSKRYYQIASVSKDTITVTKTNF